MIDSNYTQRVEERRSLISIHASIVMGSIPEGVPAVQELYSYLLADYLPSRYPAMFSVSENGKTFKNHVTNMEFPCLPPQDPLQAWRILGETVEDDMFLLLNTDQGHRAVSFCCCFYRL